MKCSILQPHYFPWCGYFGMIKNVKKFMQNTCTVDKCNTNNYRVDNYCCPYGKYLDTTDQSYQCKPGTVNCPHGTPASTNIQFPKDKGSITKCESCNSGYKLTNNTCNYCTNNKNVDTFDKECTITNCNSGYYLSNNNCEPWKGGCNNGTEKQQKERTGDHQCGSCDPGYYLDTAKNSCTLGTVKCDNGTTPAPSKPANKDNNTPPIWSQFTFKDNISIQKHCESCNKGYYLDTTTDPDNPCKPGTVNCDNGTTPAPSSLIFGNNPTINNILFFKYREYAFAPIINKPTNNTTNITINKALTVFLLLR